MFPPFRLDTANECLWRADTRILLPPKVFSVLEYLVRNAGRLVPQEELLEAVWPETFVQPEVLRKYILEIRKVLDDPAKKPRFVETVPRRGYRFVAEVHEQRQGAGLPETPDRDSELVGREAPLAELNAEFEAARQGARRVIFVTGEPGIGKTRLADAFQHSLAPDADVRMVRGQCVEGFAGKEAYYPVLEALGGLMGGPHGEMVVETLAGHAPTWLMQFPSFIQPRQKDKLQQELLGATRERMVRELCDALEILTRELTLVLILEDLQWVDNPTLDLVSAIARRRGPARFMLLATYRPADVILSRNPLMVLKSDLLVHRLCSEISLNRLDAASIGTYLAARFPEGNISELLTPLIHRLSDGNPLFMVAILERLLHAGLIKREGAAWTLAVLTREINLDIPETLQQMLETQLGHLTAAELQLLRAASVAGGRFSSWMPSALLNIETEQVEEVCDSFVTREQFLKRVSSLESPEEQPDTEYEFRHILYREVLYRQLNLALRRKLHLRLAGRMETMSTFGDPALAAELAFHYEQGRDYRKAAWYLMVTATNAIKRYAHAESIRVLQHALDLLSRVPGREHDLELSVLGRISDSLYASGEMQQSAEIDYRIADLAAQSGHRAEQVHALTRAARCLAFLDPGRCVAVCDKAVEVSRTMEDPLLQARAQMLASSWQIVTNGWKREIAVTCEAAGKRLRELDQELPAYYGILYAHVQCIQGDYSGALATARSGIIKAVEDDSLVVYLSAHSSMAHALLHLGQWNELLQVLSTAREIAGKNGNAPWLGIFDAFRAWLYFQACDLDRAITLATHLLHTHSEQPAGQAQTMAMVARACAQIESGSPEAAIADLTTVCNRPEEPRFFMDWYWRTHARLALGSALEITGDPVGAAREAQRCLEATLGGADPNLKALARELDARVHVNGAESARFLLDQAFAELANRDLPIAEWRLHRTASQLWAKVGDASLADRHRTEAVRILRQLAGSCPEGTPERTALTAAAQSQLSPSVQPRRTRRQIAE